jgi:hypothetical protein
VLTFTKKEEEEEEAMSAEKQDFDRNDQLKHP